MPRWKRLDIQINKNIACDFLISLHFGVEKFLFSSTKNVESTFVHRALYSDLSTGGKPALAYTLRLRRRLSALMGLVHASIARGITASFVSGKSRLATSAKRELSKFFRKKTSPFVLFQHINYVRKSRRFLIWQRRNPYGLIL